MAPAEGRANRLPNRQSIGGPMGPIKKENWPRSGRFCYFFPKSNIGGEFGEAEEGAKPPPDISRSEIGGPKARRGELIEDQEGAKPPPDICRRQIDAAEGRLAPQGG